MLIYQIFCRLFGNHKPDPKINGSLKESGVGKFNAINTSALRYLKSMGVTHIWLTGIIDHATTTAYPDRAGDPPEIVKGKAGSPYAIRDYYCVCPDLAENPDHAEQELRTLIKRIHQHGLKVLIDFVPNHTARTYTSKQNRAADFGAHDNPQIHFHPTNNYYYLESPFKGPRQGSYTENPARATANDIFTAEPHEHDWYDSVKLNYGIDYQNQTEHFDPIPDTWSKMKAILLFWAEFGIDGWRCDMVELVPLAFWKWIIPAIKTLYPNLIFIAEIYTPQLYRSFIASGFDYLYDKQHFYDTLKRILKGQENCDSIPAIWQKLEGLSPYMLRFLENHDEERLASEVYCNGAERTLPAICLMLMFNHEATMLYFGQEFGEKAAGVSGFSQDDGRTTIFDYWTVPSHARWFNRGKCDGGQLLESEQEVWASYKTLLEAYRTYPALREGLFFDLQYYNRNAHFQGYSEWVYAYLKYDYQTQFLIVLNFSGQLNQVLLKIPPLAFDMLKLSHATYQLNDVLDSNSTPSFASSAIQHPHDKGGLSLTLKPYSASIFKLA